MNRKRKKGREVGPKVKGGGQFGAQPVDEETSKGETFKKLRVGGGPYDVRGLWCAYHKRGVVQGGTGGGENVAKTKKSWGKKGYPHVRGRKPTPGRGEGSN